MPTKAELEQARADIHDLHDRGYRAVYPAALKAMREYAAVLRRRLDTAAYGMGRPLRARVLTAAGGPIAEQPGGGFDQGDVQHLLSILEPAGATDWPQILTSTLMPSIAGWLGQMPLPAADPAVVTAASAWREAWLEERTQTLLGVPDEVAGELRTELNRLAGEAGTDVRDAKAAAQKMLDQGYPTWTNRAQLIARTEVVSANNQGAYAAWLAIAGTLGPGATVEKTWVGGTRPTHSAVSGTTIPIEQKFEVGGTEMTGPGDGAGGASEVCNCKCGLSYEVIDSGATPGLSTVDAGEDEEGAAASGEESAAREPEASTAAPTDFTGATDDELSGMLADASGRGDDEAMNRILTELDRRDAELASGEDTQGMTAEERAQDARYVQLLNSGADPQEAFREVYGGPKETTRINEAIAQLRSLGYKGSGWKDLTRDVFYEEADRLFWLAEKETNGYLLNAAGKRAGIDPKSLFTGPEPRARKYASDELRQFWQQYTRVTVYDIRAGLLGGEMRAAGTAAWA